MATRTKPDPVQTPTDEGFVSAKRPPEPMTDEELFSEAERIFNDDLVDPAVIDEEITITTPLDALMGRRGLHAKIADVILEVGYIQKTGEAPKAMGGYSFVEAGKIAAKLRTALAKRQVTMLPESVSQVGDIIEHETRSGGTLFIQTIHQRWRLTDAETGETTTIESMGTGGDSGDKFSPKAQTNAMKYALQVGFLLETGDDPEKFDLSDVPQGPGVTIGPSNVEGVLQGGRQQKVTTPQLDAIRKHARRLDLGPEELAAVIGSATGGKTPTLDPEDETSDQQRTVLAFLGELDFSEAGAIIQALEATPDPS